VRVDLMAKKLEDGGDYLAINPKGAVPALEMDDGEVLTENAVVLQYICDRAGNERLLPAGGLPRYRVLEWLGYIATELHKGFGPLWSPQTPEELKEVTRGTIAKKFDFVQERLGGDYLRGRDFTAADPYFFAILRWTDVHGIDLGRWPPLVEYLKRVAARPAVAKTLSSEGITG
jgi:glutathione S-transferase